MSEHRACMDCGGDLKRLYPNANEHLAWGHTTLEDAELCARDKAVRPWPVPQPCRHPVVWDSLPSRCAECGEVLDD